MGKFSHIKKEAINLYRNITDVTSESFTFWAKQIADEIDLDYEDSFRKRLYEWVSIDEDKDEDLSNNTDTNTNQYSSSSSSAPSAWDKDLGRFLTIEEFCIRYGLNKDAVKSSKLISHNLGHMTYNIAFFTPEEEAVLEVNNHLEDIIKKYITADPLHCVKLHDHSEWFDRLVITDVHIGMSVNGDGDPLYDAVWDKEELLRRLNVTVQHCVNHKKSSTLYIDDLGDFLDGLGGQTTRRGHPLPQNMNDKEAFDLALEFKLVLVESLLEHYEVIHLNNITNDNHAGVFGYFAASAIKQILETKYKNVYVNNVKRFIDHYKVGNHTFIISHGKDSEALKFGFKPVLDSKQAEKIDQYCKEHKLYNGNYIEFSKGDSHQAIYDDTTSNDFHYYNYPAFSPPSNWVKTCFKNSKSGFRFYNINKNENTKIAIPYWF